MVNLSPVARQMCRLFSLVGRNSDFFGDLAPPSSPRASAGVIELTSRLCSTALGGADQPDAKEVGDTFL